MSDMNEWLKSRRQKDAPDTQAQTRTSMDDWLDNRRKNRPPTIGEQSKPSPSRNATFADNAKSLGHDVVTALAGTSNALWHLADGIIPDEAVSRIFGVENKVGQFFDKQDAVYDAIRKKNKELGQKADKAVEVIGDYITRPVSTAIEKHVEKENERTGVSQYASAKEAAAANAEKSGDGKTGPTVNRTVTIGGTGLKPVTVSVPNDVDVTYADAVKLVQAAKLRESSAHKPMFVRVAERRAEYEARRAELREKLGVWETPATPADYEKQNELFLNGETPEVIKEQIQALDKALAKGNTAFEMDIVSEDRAAQRREATADWLAGASDAEKNLTYLMNSYAGGIADWGQGFTDAADSIKDVLEKIPGASKEEDGPFYSPAVIVGDREARTSFDSLREEELKVHEEHVSDNMRNIGGPIARGLGYSTPGLLMSWMFPVSGAGSTGATTAGLVKTLKTPSLWAGAAKTAAKNVALGAANNLKNPQFWTTFIPMYGSTYKEARSEGATEGEAHATAFLSAFPGAHIEIGSGFQTIPGNKVGVWQLVKNIGEEVGEEEKQDIIGHIAKKAVYAPDKEWFSLTNPEAVINPERMWETAKITAATSFLLSGSSTLVQAASERAAYTAAAKSFLGENGADVKQGVALVWFSTAPGTEVHTAAETMAKNIQEGKQPSDAAFGRLLLESQTEEAVQARRLYVQTMDSAVQTGVNAETAQAVGAVAARFGRDIRFVSPEELRVEGETQDDVGADTQAAQDGALFLPGGKYFNGKILLSSALSAEEAIEFVLKHELVHSVETTKQWEQLADIVQAQMGDEQWSQALEETLERYGAQQGDFTMAQAEREVVADWIGDNLYKSGFAKAIVNGDATIGNAFVRTIDRLRLALGTKKSRSHTNLTVVERLFLRALESKASSSEGGYAQYKIGYTTDNRPVVVINEDILSDVSYEQYIDVAEDILKNRFPNGVPVSGRLIKINKITRDEYTHSRNTRYYKAKDGALYADKMRAAGNLDEIMLASTNYINEDLNHARKDKIVQFARGDVLMRINGNDYSARVIIGLTSGNRMLLYDVVDFRPTKFLLKTKREADMRSPFMQKNAKNSSDIAASNTNVPQKSTGVNTQYMQDGAEHAQTAGKAQYALVGREHMQGDAAAEEELLMRAMENDTETEFVGEHTTSLSLKSDEIQTIQSIGRKSINDFSHQDILATEKLARRHWAEMGTKSPFYRAWFGDWRANDKTPVQIANKPGNTRGIQKNLDTGWDIQVSGKVFNETNNHTASHHIAAKPYLFYINDIVQNAVLLDSFSIDLDKKKSPNSLLMHSLYAVADIGNGPEILKLYVEEMNNPNTDNTSKRAYQLQNIGKYQPTGKSSQKSASSMSPATGTVMTVADLFALVKSFDKNFKPKDAGIIFFDDDKARVQANGKVLAGMDVQDGAEHAQTAGKPQYALVGREMLEDEAADIRKGEADSQEYSEQAMSEALERVREARRAGTEKSRREADSELARRIADREISAEVGAREITAGRKASVEDNDKKWRTGNRGPRDAKEMAKEANRQYSENSREERRKTELRQTAVRLRDELYNALEGPTKKKHIPPPMIPDVVSLLEAVYEDPAQIEENIKSLKKQRENTVNPVRIDDLDKKINANRRKFQSVSENLDRIRSQYKKCENDETYHGVYDERFAGYLQRVQVLMEGKGVRDLDSKELTQLVDILRAVGKQVLEYNRLRSEAFNKEAAQTADEWIQQIKKTETNDGALHVTIGNLNRWQLTPERFFNDTCGWVKDNVGAVIAAAAAEGESRRLKTMRLFGELFYELANKKEYDRLTSINQKDLVDIGLVDEEGAAIYLSRGLMLGLYNHLICPGNRQALLDAGLHVPNLKEYYAGRVVHAYDRGSQRITVSGLTKQIHAALHKADEAETKQEFDEAYRQLTELTERANQDVDRLLDAIEEHMTDYERKLMHTVREWFDKVSKERINEVTMDVWGYESARVERYYPIHRNTDFVNKPIDSLVSDHSLEGSGFLKSRVRSKAPVLLTDISAELENSCEAVSRLYGFLPFTSDFQKIYNGYSADHKDSVKSVIANNYGKGKTIVGVTGQQYIENFLEDIAGAKKSDSTVLTPLRRYYVRATMSVNLRVAVSQLSALPTAGAELGWEYVAKAVKYIGKISPDERALMLKHSEYLYERSRGAGGTEEIHLAKEGSNPIDKFYNWIDKKTKGKLFGWCQAVDVKTVSTLWFGCKEKIKDTRPDLEVGSDAYYEAVGQELNRVIRKTQANYTVTDMSDLMRNKSEMLKFLTMFKADANQSYNILYESTMRLKKYKADYDAGINGVTAEDVKAAKSALVSAYTSVLAGSAIAFALLRALINFLTHNVNGYRNKEGEITGESVASRVGQEMLSSVAGMFVFGDVVYEVLESRVFGENYYGVSDMGMQALSDVLENLATGNYTTAKGWMYLTEDLCNVLGVPFRNVKNLVNGFRYHIEDIANGEFLSMNAGYSVADSVYYSRLHKAIAKGDEEKAEALRQYLLSTGKTEAQINSGLRAVLKKSDKQVQKEAERFLKDVLENALYDQLNEREKRKVESGLLGYLADKKLQTESGDDMTKAHQKAETMIKKGVSPSDYFLMQVVKNAMFVDEDEDGEVSKEEYRQVLDETDYEEHIKKLLLSIKR